MEAAVKTDLEQVKKQLEALQNEYLKKEDEILSPLTLEEREKLGHKGLKNVHRLESFMANSKKFVVYKSLPIVRFEIFEETQIKVGYGVDFRQMFQNIKKAYEFLNTSESANAAVTLWNVMNGIKDHLEERENEVLILCSLFICYENEDITTYDKELNNQKIQDWKKEGIAMDSFFTLAFSLVNAYSPIYKESILNISDHIEKVKEEIGVKKKSTQTEK